MASKMAAQRWRFSGIAYRTNFWQYG